MAEQKKIALVTGASQGIGLACAKRLNQDGRRVIGIDVYKPDKLGSEFAGFLTVDVRDSAACKKLFKRSGKLTF